MLSRPAGPARVSPLRPTDPGRVSASGLDDCFRLLARPRVLAMTLAKSPLLASLQAACESPPDPQSPLFHSSNARRALAANASSLSTLKPTLAMPAAALSAAAWPASVRAACVNPICARGTKGRSHASQRHAHTPRTGREGGTDGVVARAGGCGDLEAGMAGRQGVRHVAKVWATGEAADGQLQQQQHRRARGEEGRQRTGRRGRVVGRVHLEAPVVGHEADVLLGQDVVIMEVVVGVVARRRDVDRAARRAERAEHSKASNVSPGSGTTREREGGSSRRTGLPHGNSSRRACAGPSPGPMSAPGSRTRPSRSPAADRSRQHSINRRQGKRRGGPHGDDVLGVAFGPLKDAVRAMVGRDLLPERRDGRV